MQNLISSLITSLMFGMWNYAGSTFHMIIWAGAAGCTTYFLSEKGWKGAARSFCSIISGMIWSILSLYLTSRSISSSISMMITTFFMCIQGSCSPFFFTPGIFIGCFSSFAVNVISPAYVLSCLTGIGIGLLSDFISGHLAQYAK